MRNAFFFFINRLNISFDGYWKLRFASIFSILQISGVAVLEAMQILTETINNQALAREFKLISERLEQGRGNEQKREEAEE